MVEKIIAETLKIDINSIRDECKLVEDLGADSLNIVELVMEIEDKYDISVSDEDAENIFTVADIKQYVEDNA
jgi:acyl carrier protein